MWSVPVTKRSSVPPMAGRCSAGRVMENWFTPRVTPLTFDRLQPFLAPGSERKDAPRIEPPRQEIEKGAAIAAQAASPVHIRLRAQALDEIGGDIAGRQRERLA